MDDARPSKQPGRSARTRPERRVPVPSRAGSTALTRFRIAALSPTALDADTDRLEGPA